MDFARRLLGRRAPATAGSRDGTSKDKATSNTTVEVKMEFESGGAAATPALELTPNAERRTEGQQQVKRARQPKPEPGSITPPPPTATPNLHTATPNVGVVRYKGVQVCGSGTTLWRTRMTLPGLRSRHINLGQFAVAEEAARAYDRAARKYFVNPIVNFLDDGSLNPDRLMIKQNQYRPGMRDEAMKILAEGQTTGSSKSSNRKGSPPFPDVPVRSRVMSFEEDDDSDRASDTWSAEGGAGAGSDDGYEEDTDSDREDGEVQSKQQQRRQQEQATRSQAKKKPRLAEGHDRHHFRPPQKWEASRGQSTKPSRPSGLIPSGLMTAIKQEHVHCQPAFKKPSASHRPATTASQTASASSRAASVDVWLELKATVFRKLMSALPKDEARKYKALSYMLEKPTASLRGFVEEVVPRSGFNGETADRAAGLLADMVERGQFDDDDSD